MGIERQIKGRAKQFSISVLFWQVHKSRCVTKRGHIVESAPQKTIPVRKGNGQYTEMSCTRLSKQTDLYFSTETVCSYLHKPSVFLCAQLLCD